MSHYFDTPTTPDKRKQIEAAIWERDYTFTTATGVFSGARLDPGTAVLFRETTPPVGAVRALDLGCGFGPIAVALATECPKAVVHAVDVNERALELTRLNAEAAGVGDRVEVFTPEDAPDGEYDQIWSHPPIRIGKAALHELLLIWLPRLTTAGEAWLVVSKNLGADSLQRWITEQTDHTGQTFECERMASAKGFRVLRVSRGDNTENMSQTG